MILHAWMYHTPFICSSGGGHLSWLHLLIIVNNVAKNTGTKVSIQVSALNTVSNLLGCGIAWWYSVFDFLRNHHITYEISPIHQQCTSLIFLYACQHILFFFLLIIAFRYFFFFKYMFLDRKSNQKTSKHWDKSLCCVLGQGPVSSV